MFTDRPSHDTLAPSSLEHETRGMWATTATSGFDATGAANDEVGLLGIHAAACKLANGGIRRVIDTLGLIDSFLRSRLISAAVGITLAAGVAVWIFG